MKCYKLLDTRISYRFNKQKLAEVSLGIPSRVRYDGVRNAACVVYDGSGVVPVLEVTADF